METRHPDSTSARWGDLIHNMDGLRAYLPK